MIFLCGLFIPLEALPVFLKPISYVLPLTYGVDILHGAIGRGNSLPMLLDFGLIAFFCALLFTISLRNIKHKWIV